jgi:hypothetical protein
VIHTHAIPILYREQFTLNSETVNEYISRAFSQFSETLDCPTDDNSLNDCVRATDMLNSCANVSSELPCSTSIHNLFEKCQHCHSQNLGARIQIKTKLLLKNEFDAILANVKNEFSDFHSRHKRGLLIFQDLLEFCCNSANTGQIIDLQNSDSRLSKQFNVLREAVADNHKNLLSFDRQIRSVASLMEHNIKNIARISFASGEQIALKTTIAYYIQLLMLHFRQITQFCHQNLIPPNVISSKTLADDLLKLKSELSSHDQVLAIPISDIAEYYKVKIARCRISDNEIEISVKIPIVSSENSFSIFEVIPIPFAYQNQICEIKIEKSLVIFEQNSRKLYVLSGAQLQACNIAEKLCTLKSNILDRNAMCISNLFFEKSRNSINAACMFECRTDHSSPNNKLPLINNIGYLEYVLTNPNPNNVIEFQNNTRYLISLPTNSIGAYHITLPCGSSLIQINQNSESTLISPVIPCFEIHPNPSITRIVPGAWTNLPQGTLESSLLSKNIFDYEFEILNHDWKSSVPVSDLETQDQFEKKFEKLSDLQSSHNSILRSPLVRDISIFLLFLFAILTSLFFWRSIRTLRAKLYELRKNNVNLELYTLMRQKASSSV